VPPTAPPRSDGREKQRTGCRVLCYVLMGVSLRRFNKSIQVLLTTSSASQRVRHFKIVFSNPSDRIRTGSRSNSPCAYIDFWRTVTLLLASSGPGHSAAAAAVPVGLLGPPIHSMRPCSRPEEDANAWKQFGQEPTWAIEPRYRPPGQRWILDAGLRGGGPSRLPFWGTLEESCNGLGSVSLK